MTLTMLFFLLCCDVVVRAAPSEAPPAPPRDVHVDSWLLTWTPTIEDTDVTYTVQYSTRFDADAWRHVPAWKNVPACVQTSFTSCNVGFTKAEAEHGCVMLRVRAKRHGLTSEQVTACSRHSDSCTPEFRLTARPGSLTVHLSRNHNLSLEHADNAKHRVYYGKEGELLQKFEDSASSVSIDKLEEGQRYCARVQYIYHGNPVGLTSCTLCEVIPKSATTQMVIIVAVVVVVILLVIVIPLIAYILIFQRNRIKQWLRPPYEMPDNLTTWLDEEHRILSCTSSPSEEICDTVSSIIPAVVRGN